MALNADANPLELAVEGVASALPWEPVVAEALSSLPETEPVAVACSGGADSVAVLLGAVSRYGKRVVVLHYNHNTRGADSDADAAYVGELAQRLGLRFVSGKRAASGLASEAELRDARLAFFAETGLRHILTGHHEDDVAETVLMRLLRGASIEGLSAPRPMSRVGGIQYYRPLLATPKLAIVSALEAQGVGWRDDASNQSAAYLRNRIRNEVLPLLEAVSGRQVATTLARARRTFSECMEALEAMLSALPLTLEAGEPLLREPLLGQPRALWRLALQRWLAVQGLTEQLNHTAAETLLQAMCTGEPSRLSAGEGWLVTNEQQVCFESARVVVQWPPAYVMPQVQLFLPEGWLCVERCHLTSQQLATILSGRSESVATQAWLNPDAVRLPLKIRRRSDGDRYRPLGAPGSRKLQDCFVDRKIPLEERNRLPVVCSADNTLLWVPGLLPSDVARLTKDSKVALRLTYRTL